MPVPKVGTKSIQKAFANYLFSTSSDERFNTSVIDTKGFPFYKVSKSKVKKLRDHEFVFSFVRNPFHRILSCYFDKIRKETSYKGFSRYKNQFSREMSFEKFVETIAGIPDSAADQHFRSQHKFLTDENWNLIPHFIGKLEHIEEDFKKVVEKINSENLEIKHINKSKTKKNNFENYFTPQVHKMIQERYATDFQLFNYSMDLESL